MFTRIIIILLAICSISQIATAQNIPPSGPDPRSRRFRPFTKKYPPILILEIEHFELEAMPRKGASRLAELSKAFESETDDAKKKNIKKNIDEMLEYHERNADMILFGRGVMFPSNEKKSIELPAQAVLTVRPKHRGKIKQIKIGDFIQTFNPMHSEDSPNQLASKLLVRPIPEPVWWVAENISTPGLPSLPGPNTTIRPVNPFLDDDWPLTYYYYIRPEPTSPESVRELADVLDGVMPAVFTIRTSNAIGTGFLINDEGVALTNKHVIEGHRNFKATMNDESEISGTVIGICPNADLALVRLKGDHFPFLRFHTKTVRIGEPLIVIGAPRGLSHSVSRGIVSAYRDLDNIKGIQTDAAMNPGNSGGPAILITGEVIGICTWTLSETEGINFAISIEEAISRLPLVLKDPSEKRGFGDIDP